MNPIVAALKQQRKELYNFSKTELRQLAVGKAIQYLKANPRMGFMAPEGGLLASIDFKAQEVYTAAVASGDPQMLKAMLDDEYIVGPDGKQYKNPYADLHTLSARCTHPEIFKNVPEHLWRTVAENPDLISEKGSARHWGKVLNFGIMYGQGAKAMASLNHQPEYVCRAWIENHERAYSTFHHWKSIVMQQAEKLGWTRAADGRIRYCKESNSKGSENAEGRVAANFVIQGPCATMAKEAAIKLSKTFEGTKVRVLSFIHDEALIEIPGEVRIDKDKLCRGEKNALVFNEEAKYWANIGKQCLEEAEHEVFLKWFGKDLPGMASVQIGLWWAH
jgi:hypothetical protein